MLSDDSVYERLRTGVVEGRYPPGSRLIEQALAEELGVSRTPVRESLRRLEADGLVVSVKNRGAEVRGFTAAEVDDLYELRGRLEAYATELAAARRTPEQLSSLRAAAEEFAAAAPEAPSIETTRRLNVANRVFHDTIVAAAGHHRLAAMLRGTVDVPLVFQALLSFDQEQLQRSAMFHLLIADAIESAEPARAARLMAEHIAQGLDMVRHLVAAPGQ